MAGFVRKRILGLRPAPVVSSRVASVPPVSVEDEVVREREERVRSAEQRRKGAGALQICSPIKISGKPSMLLPSSTAYRPQVLPKKLA